MNKILKKYKSLSVMAKASLWALIASLLQKGINILFTPIFTRILTTEEFAQYNLYQSWHDIFIIFSSLNVFNYATYSAMKKYEDNKDEFIATAQSVVTLLSLCCFAIYYIIHIIFGDVIGFSLPVVILMFFDILFFASYNLWFSKERYNFKYKVLTIVSILIGILGPVVGLILTFILNNKGYGRIYGVASINIIFGLIIYIYSYKKSKIIIKKEYCKFIFSYCLPLIPHFLASQILIRFDRIMINNMCGMSEVGIYSLAYSLSSLMVIFNDAILKSYTPWTYQVLENKDMNNNFKSYTNMIIVLIGLLNFSLILVAPEVISIFATKEYGEAIYIIPAVSSSIYYMFLFNVFANVEYYYSETTFVGIASICAAIINVILNYIFISIYGYLAAGFTTLISYVFYAIGHYIFMKKVSKKYNNSISYFDDKFILIFSIIFTIFSLMIIPMYSYNLIRYIFIGLIIVSVFVHKKKIINILKKEKN